jgi:ABC-2 type transport system ATP-binding protein
MLLGLIRPTAGGARLLGEPIPDRVSAALPRVGSLVEGPAFHPYLSGRHNLARLDAADPHADPGTGWKRIDAALDRVGLLAAAGKNYRAYSLGMRQRLAIAAALLQPRDLLILDEPTNGLDPQGTREVRHLVTDLAGDGATILISSHLLGEVEQICSHIGVMHTGRLLAEGPIDELRDKMAAGVRIRTAEPKKAQQVLIELGVTETEVNGGHDHGLVTGAIGKVEVPAIMPAMVAAGVSVYGFTVDSPSLEDVFVELTGEGFDVSG